MLQKHKSCKKRLWDKMKIRLRTLTATKSVPSSATAWLLRSGVRSTVHSTLHRLLCLFRYSVFNLSHLSLFTFITSRFNKLMCEASDRASQIIKPDWLVSKEKRDEDKENRNKRVNWENTDTGVNDEKSKMYMSNVNEHRFRIKPRRMTSNYAQNYNAHLWVHWLS